MLLLGSAFDVGGLTVFADHVSPVTFHYLPGQPKLVRATGRPGAQLLRYRGSSGATAGADASTGGGLLTLDVHLGFDARAREDAREALARRAGADVSLVPVTFNEGHVRVAVLDADTRAPSDTAPARTVLVERVLATAAPALFGDARAIFSVALSAEGASLIEQTLRARALPVAITYELSFEGLRLARGLRARVEYRMAYDFLRTRLGAGMLAFKADLDREAETLRREQLIAIEDIDYTGADTPTLAARAEEIRTTLQELVEALFFRPAVSPAALPVDALSAQPAVAGAWAGAAHGKAAFVLRDLAQQEEGTLEYDLTSTRVARQTIAPQGALTALEGFTPDDAIRDVDLTDRGPRVVRIFVPAGADWTGVGAVEVTVEPPAGPPVSDAVRPDRTDVEIQVPDGDVTYRTRVLVRSDPEAIGSPVEIESAAAPLPADTVVLDPASLAVRRLVTIALASADPGSRIRVRGSIDVETASRPFALDAARPSLAVAVWGRAPARLSTAVEIDGAVAETSTREVSPGERLVVVNPPRDRVRMVVVELVDPLDRFESVFVELEADTGGNRQQVHLDASTPRAEWMSIVAVGERASGYRHRIRKIFRNAASVELPWTAGAGQLLLVGDTGVRIVPVDIVLVGAPADAIATELTVTSLAAPPDVPASVNVIVEATRATVRVPFATGAATRYRVEGRVFTETGERAIAPVEDVGEICLLPIG